MHGVTMILLMHGVNMILLMHGVTMKFSKVSLSFMRNFGAVKSLLRTIRCDEHSNCSRHQTLPHTQGNTQLREPDQREDRDQNILFIVICVINFLFASEDKTRIS